MNRKPYIHLTNSAVESATPGCWLRLYVAEATPKAQQVGALITSGGGTTTYAGVEYRSLGAFLRAWEIEPVRCVELLAVPGATDWAEGATVDLDALGLGEVMA